MKINNILTNLLHPNNNSDIKGDCSDIKVCKPAFDKTRTELGLDEFFSFNSNNWLYTVLQKQAVYCHH